MKGAAQKRVRPDPFTHASRLQERACAGHRPGEIDQRAIDLGSGAQDLGDREVVHDGDALTA